LTEGREARRGPLVAAAIILVVVVAGWLVMPRIMLMVSGGGPLAGVAVAIAFMLAFFAVLWLRARHQRRFNRD
jgi:Flp pilus assembly protein TadB